jgi:hypothetical protein
MSELKREIDKIGSFARELQALCRPSLDDDEPIPVVESKKSN